ncbi:hypothetical protein PoB_001611300 [Plakobranchus ocellatus]|uniref:Uncharacterized protein n=1 Tax=Plakobranchus ocellatus TaxID=259542 RepID=A0AAV3Z4N8_9GAST|nr:hypothetical protein PoB_001611300 [Plakobranchus ocellatus]
MRKEMLQRLHSFHAGIEKNKRRARESNVLARNQQRHASSCEQMLYLSNISEQQTERTFPDSESIKLPWNTVGLDVSLSKVMITCFMSTATLNNLKSQNFPQTLHME